VSAALAHAALFLPPAAVLWTLLMLGRYPGEAALARLTARRRRRPLRPPRMAARVPATVARRALDPLACSLAGRAPPAGRISPSSSIKT
jgi:hypothetical protein